MKILMVCLGNICRSPLAHGILDSKLKKQDFIVDSAGTASYHIGEQPDHRSIEVARINGIDISGQRARKFSVSDFDRFDRIYAMDVSNLNNLEAMARNQTDLDKLFLFMEANSSSSYSEVPDPYYGDFSDFENVFDLVNETCDLIVDDLDKS
ncbi:MAG: low molecular weight protein-tyrosine-phosphatase [Bacteroidota bacterium]